MTEDQPSSSGMRAPGTLDNPSTTFPQYLNVELPRSHRDWSRRLVPGSGRSWVRKYSPIHTHIHRHTVTCACHYTIHTYICTRAARTTTTTERLRRSHAIESRARYEHRRPGRIVTHLADFTACLFSLFFHPLSFLRFPLFCLFGAFHSVVYAGTQSFRLNLEITQVLIAIFVSRDKLRSWSAILTRTH